MLSCPAIFISMRKESNSPVTEPKSSRVELYRQDVVLIDNGKFS